MRQTTRGERVIDVDVPDDLGLLAIDDKLLRHILTNLLSNAVKYSGPESPVSLTVSLQAEVVTFSVRDHGIGIPEQDLEQLFESFHRCSNVGDIKGTGLGLAVVKRAVDRHGGTIDVTSEVGAGTEFIVRLPVGSRA
jgi:signal transduction histidine kinase